MTPTLLTVSWTVERANVRYATTCASCRRPTIEDRDINLRTAYDYRPVCLPCGTQSAADLARVVAEYREHRDERA
jgi:hypothetical protein